MEEEKLFATPISDHMGDCPVCRMSYGFDSDLFLTSGNSSMYAKLLTALPCCSRQICSTCSYAIVATCAKMGKSPRCPFCREIFLPKSHMGRDRYKQHLLERCTEQDPLLLFELAELSLADNEIEIQVAFDYFLKAAYLGHAHSMFEVGVWLKAGYSNDMVKNNKEWFFSQAAINGHPIARYFLGMIKVRQADFKSAVHHLKIASFQGVTIATKELLTLCRYGHCANDDCAEALRKHSEKVKEIKDEIAAKEKIRNDVKKGVIIIIGTQPQPQQYIYLAQEGKDPHPSELVKLLTRLQFQL